MIENDASSEELDSGEPVACSIRHGVAKLLLARPQRLNSFTTDMHKHLIDAIDNLSEDASVRALIITGAGRAFCSGQDLNERKRAPGEPAKDLGLTVDRYWNRLVRSLRALEFPVICAVNGVAAGAGANLALACDIVFAAESASFIQPFSKLGLIPDAGGTYALPHLVGNARAMALAMLGTRISAREAEAMGLIWKCVADEILMKEVHESAEQLARQSRTGLAAIKRAMHSSFDHTFDDQLELERELQQRCGFTSEYQDGVTRFFEAQARRRAASIDVDSQSEDGRGV